LKSLDTNVLARFFIDDPDDVEATSQRPAAVAALSERALVKRAKSLAPSFGVELLK
jgi:hypothetical protein